MHIKDSSDDENLARQTNGKNDIVNNDVDIPHFGNEDSKDYIIGD